MLERALLVALLIAATIGSVSVSIFILRSGSRRVPAQSRAQGSPYRTRVPSEAEPAGDPVPRWWGKHGVIADAMVMLSLAFAVALFAALGAGDDESQVWRWAFAHDTPSARTQGFTVTTEEAGLWRIEKDPRATGAHAFVNHAGTPGSPPAMAIATEPSERNVRVRTRCRVLPSGEPRACGLVFRHRDLENYYSARIDFGSQRVVLSVVENGSERILARAAARLELGVWQEIAVDARGQDIRVSWNAEPVLQASDSTHLAHGGAGLWTAATAVAHFDELWVERLPNSTVDFLNSAPPSARRFQ